MNVFTFNKDSVTSRANELRAQGKSLREVAKKLNQEGFRTKNGCRYGQGTVHFLLKTKEPEVTTRRLVVETTESYDSLQSVRALLGMRQPPEKILGMIRQVLE